MSESPALSNDRPRPARSGREPVLQRRLRDATASVHRAVESHPLLSPLLSPDLSLADYTRVLGCFLDFYRALEQNLNACLPLPCASGYDYIRRAPLLQEDLRALGVKRSAQRRNGLSLPALDSPGRVLGVLYVTEGATQGGRLIGPAVSRALTVTPERGARFFYLFQQGFWPRFRAVLGQVADHDEMASAEAGALETFESLRAHLDAWMLRPHRPEPVRPDSVP